MTSRVISLIALMMVVVWSKPTPQQIAEFEQLYALRMEQWLLNKTEDQ